MPLSEILEKKYQAIFSIPFAPGGRNLSIQYCENLNDFDSTAINSGIKRMAIPTDNAGLPVRIDRDLNGHYTVETASDGKIYTIVGEEYRETLLWVLYCLAFGIQMEPSQQASSYDIETKSFSSDRSAVASAIIKETDYQAGPFTEHRRLEKLLKGIAAEVCKDYLDVAPLYSNHPVSEEVFNQLRGGLLPARLKDISVKELQKKLFPGRDFKKEVESFCKFISSRDSYSESIESYQKQLDDFMYSIPLAAISEALSTLDGYIKKLTEEEATEEPNGNRIVSRFVMNKKGLKAAFSEYDLYGRSLERKELFVKVFGDILENGYRDGLDHKKTEADTKINRLREELMKKYLIYNFVPENEKHMDWKTLADLQERDLRAVNTEWNLNSFWNLTLKTSTEKACQKWFVPEHLKRECEDGHMQDSNLCVGLPLNSCKFVWAMWVSPHTEEA